MIIKIDNPCYHCYTGAIEECRTIGCKYINYPWSEDLEADYKVDYDMTDKEIAEEWVKSNSDESVYSFQGEQLQYAFLAGLKAGRPQWHDLRKDPNDLPRQGVELLVSVDGYTRTAMYSKETNSFTCQEGVIAWMYEPEFI